MQFLSLRDGDRFFFTHGRDQALKTQPLGRIAKENVLKRSLGGILCDNLDEDILQGAESKVIGKNVFKEVSEINPQLICYHEEKLDFDKILYEAIWEARDSLKLVKKEQRPKEGVVESPKYPDSYPNGITMETKIKVEEDHVVELTIDSFDLEDDRKSGCRFDFVEIVGTSSKMGKLCGTDSSNKKFTSSSSTMTVKFHSDETRTGKGFKATWRSLPLPANT